jgi:hypothetical protein
MRMIDTKELVTMIEAGKSQKECAEYFAVSPAAICKCLKRIQAITLPESVKRLTGKQQAFVLAKAHGMTNVEAVRKSYDVTTAESAKAMGTQLMQDPDIQAAIHDLMHQTGIGRRRRIERLRDMIESNDLSVVGRGLDMANKMTGEYVQEQNGGKTEINVVINNFWKT